jgi:ABC-type antimicrobial peptide transport system permease subunit
MFFTYLRRELRRRSRQASLIALGLAVGVGLVITVTSLSTGVKNAQGQVLHSLYGVGTDITVTEAPATGSAGGFGFGFGGRRTGTRPAAGTTINNNTLRGGFTLGALSTSSVASIAAMAHVSAAAGGLTLSDTAVSGKIPSFSSGGGGFGGAGAGAGSGRGSLSISTFGVEGVDISQGELGPLSAGKISSGRTFTAADADANVAVVDSSYARQKKLRVGSAVSVAGKTFPVIGIVSEPQGDSPSDVYIPLARAQALATPALTGKVNTIYVAADSASNISAVSREISAALPKATVTSSSDLASDVTGSLASTSSLANNLGRWLAIAVLVAAFLLASLLTGAAVSRRVREFGTLKALGWRSRRVVGQVMGEAVVIGIAGGIAGVALGFLGSALVTSFSPKLTASIGQTTGSATPGGARSFGGPGGGGGFGGFHHLTPASHTVAVNLTAPVTIGAVVAAVLLALAGGLIAGGFGGWRAARLRPAAALAKVG